MWRTSLWSLPLMALMFLSPVNADLLPWPHAVEQITDNDVDDEWPDVEGGNVVWSGTGASSSEIFLWDGSSVSQLTNNSVGDWNPRIDGTDLVWGRNDQIVYRDGASETILTDTTTSDYLPVINRGQVAWRRTDSGGDSWAYFWDGSYSGGDPVIRQLGRDSGESSPMIRDGNVVWSGWDGNDGEIGMWDGTSVSYLTNNTAQDHSPVWVGPNQVAWIGGSAVKLWDNGTVSELYSIGSDLHGDGNELCWVASDADGSQIFYWDGSAVQQITFGSGHTVMEPVVSSGRVAWLERDGFDYDVFGWDGSGIYQITDNDWTDDRVRISGIDIAWESEVGGDRFSQLDHEIMHTQFPEPATAAMLGIGMIGLWWRRRSHPHGSRNGDAQ